MWTSLCTNLCYPVEIKDIIIIIIIISFLKPSNHFQIIYTGL